MSYSVDWVYDGLRDAGLALYSCGPAQIVGLPAAAAITVIALGYLCKELINQARLGLDRSMSLVDKQALRYDNRCHHRTAEALCRCAAFLLVAMIPVCGALMARQWGLPDH